jgi:transcriptional regulator with XRE-family HTH domain
MDKENSLKQTIAGNIRRLRLKKNITATELAEAVNVSQSAVSDWERGKKMPRAGTVENIANFFNVGKSDILSDKDEAAQASKIVSYGIIDLESLFEGKARVVFAHRVLSDDEKALILRILKAVIV